MPGKNPGYDSQSSEDLIRKPGRGHTQHPGRSQFLNDPDDSQLPPILVIEIDAYVSGDFVGFTHCPDWNKAPQHGNVFQSSSSVLSATHLRLIAIVSYRETKAR